MCEAILGMPIGIENPLMEAGIDSLGSAEIVARLGAEFQTSLPATLLFDHPSISSIS